MSRTMMNRLRARAPVAVQDVEAERVTSLEVRAELRIRNNSMIKARKELGLSQLALSKAVDVPFNVAQAIEKFDFSNTSTLKHARKIADFLHLPIESLVPEELKGKTLPSTLVIEGSFEADKLLDMHQRLQDRLTLPAPDESGSALENQDHRDMLSHAMLALSPQMRRALRLRYDLFGDANTRQHSLTEVGEDLGVTRERARQLLVEGIRKLQHPTLIDYLMKRLGEDPNEPMHVREAASTRPRMLIRGGGDS